MTLSSPISYVMTRDVVTVQVGDRMSRVRGLMTEKGFHHVPILDGEELVGIISARDLVQLGLSRLVKEGGDVDDTLDTHFSIRDVMKTDLVTLRENDSIEKAIDVLADGSIHSVLVINREERLVGIATNIDVLDYLFA
jgi:acetoin utilization protein AcuB